jgi:tRNA threonylcarbamoyladenosine biosynthesis protein TsaB
MRVLGIETSGEVASVAVVDERGVLAEIRFRHAMQLSRYLSPHIDQVLRMASVPMAELQGVAVSVGPGSFTGLRIGVTAAKALAYARDLPIAGISTLEALAAEHPAPPSALVCTVVSAAASGLYTALYQWVDGRLEPRATELLVRGEELAEKLTASTLPVLLLGNPGPHRVLLEEVLNAREMDSRDAEPRASTVARLGRERLLAGAGDAVHYLAPHYLRLSTPEVRRQEALCPQS